MLTQKEKQFLEENGYLNLGVLLSESEVNSINTRIRYFFNILHVGIS